MKFSRSALVAGLLILLAAALTYWAGLQAPLTDHTGLGISTLATAARWLALAALAFFVAPRRSRQPRSTLFTKQRLAEVDL